MGVLKKHFSSTGWEASDFGGFSRILWDLPDMNLPYGFYITPSSDFSYLSYYSQRKLLSLFLLKARELGYTDHLINAAQLEHEQSKMYYNATYIFKYTFSKESIKHVLKIIIAKETELKSLFVHYSNALANSKITFEVMDYDFKPDPDDDSKLKSAKINTTKKLVNAIKDIKEKKTTWSYSGSSSTVSGEKLKDLKKRSTFKVMDADDRSHHVHYEDDEIKASDKLLEMLDISFEKAESKISSLRVGKIDIPKLAEVLSGNSHIYYRKEEVEKTKPFSVCILCDESGSMDGSRKFTQHVLGKIMYRAFSQIIAPDKLYVYGHSGDNDPVIRIYQDKFNPNFESTFRQQLYNDFQQNYDGPVTDLIYEKIRSHTDDNILFIVLSDGEPGGYGYGGFQDNLDYKRVIEKCKRDGFVTCGIGIEYFSAKDLYQYSTVIQSNDETNAIKKISMLINNVVKAEFQ